jgi:hypothetical protein
MKTGKMKTSKMKTSINLKTRKMKNNYLKLVMMAAVMLSASIGFAQTNPLTNSADTELDKGAGDGASVRVIDNKGTIKYLQTNNGITSITSTNPGNTTTTTWQLGGTLVDATTITTSADGTFTIDGEEFNLANTEVNDSAAATLTDDSGSGYTFLVREEGTGQVKKMLATDLITSAYNETTVDATFIGTPAITFATIVALPTELEKISVFRNGTKLRSGKDYTILTNEITLVPGTTGDQAAPNDWALNVDDIIEVYVLKF